MKIYNTLTEKKETVRKPSKRPLRFFVCGPTVYDSIHIGNARTYVAFDLIVRYLRSRKFEVFYLQNITDIDDKIIARAKEKGITPLQLARTNEKEFLEVMEALRVVSVNKYARATDYIPQIIHQVKALIRRKNAYEIPGDGWYFDLASFSDYGNLAKRTIAQAEDGVSRIDVNEKKRNAGDFCLWKYSKPGEPSWPAEIGRGRPGWHIEDTAITEHFFGAQYDLHGGAIDLKFPHHEAEIAQMESISGKKPMVKIWMHAGFLNMAQEKMSKSLGNFITAPQMLKEITPDVFRMLVLSHHYRAPLEYNETIRTNAKKNLYSIGALLAKLKTVTGKGKKETVKLKPIRKRLTAALEDDFNTPLALGVIFELINEVNKKLWNLSREQAKEINAFLIETFALFGIEAFLPKTPPEVTRLVQMRELSRRNKQFADADALRKKIEGLGYEVEDLPKGPLVLPKV